jgi:hypothetical protein
MEQIASSHFNDLELVFRQDHSALQLVALPYSRARPDLRNGIMQWMTEAYTEYETAMESQCCQYLLPQQIQWAAIFEHLYLSPRIPGGLDCSRNLELPDFASRAFSIPKTVRVAGHVAANAAWFRCLL